MTHIYKRIKNYTTRWKINNRFVGWVLECSGYQPSVDGIRLDLSCPALTRAHKSTIAFGYHEVPERKMIKRHLRSDLPVIELGGGLGLVSCIINKRLAHPDRQFVFECNPTMVSSLKLNRALNGCHFDIVERAIAYDTDHVFFDLDPEFVGSAVSQRFQSHTNAILVDATTLSDFTEHFTGDFVLVADIEGMECEIVANEVGVLARRCRQIIMETHARYVGKEKYDQMVSSLSQAGFILVDEEKSVQVWNK